MLRALKLSTGLDNASHVAEGTVAPDRPSRKFIGSNRVWVAEITYLTWTADGLLRQTVYVGLRSDKPAAQVEGKQRAVSRQRAIRRPARHLCS
jgi:ATP-dependent DNA ligase